MRRGVRRALRGIGISADGLGFAIGKDANATQLQKVHSQADLGMGTPGNGKGPLARPFPWIG